MSAGTFKRYLAKRGEPFTYTEFTQGARDTYEDVSYTADSTPQTIRGFRIDSTDTTLLDETGQQRKVEIEILVLASESIPNADDMAERAPTMTDASGRIYAIAGVGHEGVPVGAKRLYMERQAT